MVMALCAVPFSGVTFEANALEKTGKCGENVSYTYDPSTGEVVISGTGAMYDYEGSSSPFFKGSIKSVVIEDGVTSIGDWAFYYYRGLKSVTIPNSVTSIGDQAFEYCTSLTSIVIPNSVTSIGYEAFYNCTGLTSITIPDGMTSISMWAFNGCTGLTSVTIPDSVTSIDYGAFANCTSLSSITIPDSVTSISKAAFYNTALYNNDSNWENGVLYIGNHLIKAKSSVSGVYTIKDETKIIADSAFLDCHNLTSIIIPESVVSIGYKALGYYYSHSVDNYERIYNFTVTGYRNTAAETYANENGFAFIALDEEHTHTFGEQIIGQPTCTKDGEKIFKCRQCDYSYTEVIPALGHTDNDNDGNCDRCGEKTGEPVNPPEPTNPSENCSCSCHKKGIANFFFKILLFFQKLFKKNQVCKCGAWHY